MSRAPFQVLILPYRVTTDGIQYALLRRSDAGYWQFVAGGGQDDETPLEAALRETWEEAGLSTDSKFIELEALAMLPVVDVCGFLWGPDVLLIPQHCFGVRADTELALSHEHTEYQWVDYWTARESLYWESNRIALWELDHRLTR